MVKYVQELAKYDLNYDVRDRARLIKAVLLSSSSILSQHARRLMITPKPAPVTALGKPHLIKLVSHSFNLLRRFWREITLTIQQITEAEGRTSEYVLGTLSHVVNHKVQGYQEISDFPEVPPNTDRTPEDHIASAEEANANRDIIESESEEGKI